MNNLTTLSMKSVNRLKDLAGTVQIEQAIDLGKRHAKGFRITLGHTTSGTQGRFWLGHKEDEAQARAHVVVAAWSRIVAAGRSTWTPDDLADVKTRFAQMAGAVAKFRSAHGALVESERRLNGQRLTDPEDSSELPTYQCYLSLAWLRNEGLVVQHGRQGYSLPKSGDLPSAVERIWAHLPTRS